MGYQTTFSDLGIPFPLFEAPIKLAADYEGVGYCDVCSEHNVHLFRLGVGHDLVAACDRCGQDVIFSAYEAAATPCSCGSDVSFPLKKHENITCCYQCIRRGRAAMTQDTEFGMVRLEDAVRGHTHGVPSIEIEGYDISLNDDGWSQVNISSEYLLELVRTPSFLSWQGTRWLFCCFKPMIYEGEWDKNAFSIHADGGDGQSLFERLGENGLWLGWTWAQLDSEFPGVIYAFRCQTCEDRRVYWDCS